MKMHFAFEIYPEYYGSSKKYEWVTVMDSVTLYSFQYFHDGFRKEIWNKIIRNL